MCIIVYNYRNILPRYGLEWYPLGTGGACLYPAVLQWLYHRLCVFRRHHYRRRLSHEARRRPFRPALPGPARPAAHYWIAVLYRNQYGRAAGGEGSAEPPPLAASGEADRPAGAEEGGTTSRPIPSDDAALTASTLLRL